MDMAAIDRYTNCTTYRNSTDRSHTLLLRRPRIDIQLATDTVDPSASVSRDKRKKWIIEVKTNMTLIKVVKSPFYISVKAMEQHQHLVVHPNTYFFQLLDFTGFSA